MDDSGNILIKRIAKTNVYVKSTSANGSTSPEETAISNEILKLANGGLESEKPVKLFDMKKFQQNVTRELKRGYPDRRYPHVYFIPQYLLLKSSEHVISWHFLNLDFRFGDNLAAFLG
jgi:hypothetical protein